MITIEAIRNPTKPSGFNHVTKRDGSRRASDAREPYQAQAGGGRKDRGNPKWFGPRRATPEQAAQDYCNYINKVAVVHQPQPSGRPDYYMDASGVLHVDLPPATTTTPATKSRTRKSTERELMLRMEAKVKALMKPHDMAEAKAGIGRQAIATAVGQLLMRRFETGKGRMFIVLPKTPSPEMVKFLRQQNITLVVEKEVNA